MYRLLIVDDESNIVDWLYELFSDFRGAELDIYRAYSGSEALKCLQQNKMDIVLTDIRMPGMDGFKLVGKIRESWPECKIIFLTGYDDFDYVYTAIKYDGVSYLLKNEEDELIVQAVANAIAQIREDYRMDELLDRAKERIRWALPILQQELMAGLLCRESEDQPELVPLSQQQLDELEIPLSVEQPILMLMGRIEQLPGRLTAVEKKRHLYSMNLILEKYLQTRTTLLFAEQTPGCMVWIIQPKQPAEGSQNVDWDGIQLFVREMLENVQQTIGDTLQISASYMLSGEPVKWAEAAGHYQYLKTLFDLKIGIGKEMIVVSRAIHADAADTRGQPDERARQIRLAVNKIATLNTYLEQGKRVQYMELLHQMTCELPGLPSLQYYPAQELYYGIALSMLSYINRLQLVEELAFKLELPPLANLLSHGSWEQAVAYLHRMAELLFGQQAVQQQERSAQAITVVKQYVDHHLHVDLSLVRLADLVYFNPSYLSRLFKNMTGMTISDYIFQRKVERAKTLLEQEQYKIYEVGEAVGYPSPSYFAHFFRKATGMYPQDYRDNYLTGKQNAIK